MPDVALEHDLWLDRRVGRDRFRLVYCSRCGLRYEWPTPKSKDFMTAAFITEHGGECEPEKP